jgi:hypothetical protein
MDESAITKGVTITIEAGIDNAVIGKQSIFITQDEPGVYSATIGALEIM